MGNTLSHMVLHSAGDNYEPMEEFPVNPPDNNALRKPKDAKQDSLWNKSDKYKKDKKKKEDYDFLMIVRSLKVIRQAMIRTVIRMMMRVIVMTVSRRRIAMMMNRCRIRRVKVRKNQRVKANPSRRVRVRARK